ncbi:hypothetical protein RchiOBHm_Chr4g0402821 [Rosa chinensis]|uniref:Uncharacterized protein n=1 Tax=Rosa chinensis TaxID=74649 RepID=A0A2P6QTK4_ROSCH|nr:hypothetical protein RchiOBHm_Chr4g0402821 [Rosa chinensis]
MKIHILSRLTSSVDHIIYHRQLFLLHRQSSSSPGKANIKCTTNLCLPFF